ncbi:MAG: SnoaL-like domain-containing protein [Paracoccaceae bacterium]
MTLSEIANELVAGCRENRTRENLDKLYSADAVSVEPTDMGSGRETHGLAGIHGKHDWWENTQIVHSFETDGPYLHGDNSFAVIFDADSEDKTSGQRMKFREVAIYHVADGKIVREEFFFNM